MSVDGETERKAVKTMIPEYQKVEWAEHAEELEMSHSEFVRCMVQAGRKGFSPDTSESPPPRELEESMDDSSPEGTPANTTSTPGGSDLETTILDILGTEPRMFDELLDELLSEFEAEIESTIEQLLEDGEIEHGVRGDLAVSQDIS